MPSAGCFAVCDVKGVVPRSDSESPIWWCVASLGIGKGQSHVRSVGVVASEVSGSDTEGVKEE